MHEQPNHGSETHGKIVRQPVVSHPFSAVLGRKDINYNRIACHRHHPKRQPVHNTQRNEYRQQRREHIPSENNGKHCISKQVKRFAAERVQQIPRERAYAQARNRVTRQDETNHRLSCHEFLLQVERQYWHNQIEGKKQQEICRQYVAEVCCKDAIFHAAKEQILL